jgi:alpha-aminoadipate carrier protein LysW
MSPTPATTTASTAQPAIHLADQSASVSAQAAARAACPECDAPVVFTRPPLSGQVVSCGGCGAELEVTSREPLALQLAPEVEEDWGE